MAPVPTCPLCAQRNLFGRFTCGPGADSHCARRVAAALRLAGLHLHEQSDWFGYCADIVLPVPRIVVEYDGEPWHRDKADRDEEQRQLAAVKGFLMIRLREPGLPHLNPDDLHLTVPFSLVAGRGRWCGTRSSPVSAWPPNAAAGRNERLHRVHRSASGRMGRGARPVRRRPNVLELGSALRNGASLGSDRRFPAFGGGYADLIWLVRSMTLAPAPTRWNLLV